MENNFYTCTDAATQTVLGLWWGMSVFVNFRSFLCDLVSFFVTHPLELSPKLISGFLNSICEGTNIVFRDLTCTIFLGKK